MPGTDVPIISPAELVAGEPDRVLLTLPDLLEEVRRAYPQLEGRWRIDDAALGSEAPDRQAQASKAPDSKAQEGQAHDSGFTVVC